MNLHTAKRMSRWHRVSSLRWEYDRCKHFDRAMISIRGTETTRKWIETSLSSNAIMTIEGNVIRQASVCILFVIGSLVNDFLRCDLFSSVLFVLVSGAHMCVLISPCQYRVAAIFVFMQ